MDFDWNLYISFIEIGVVVITILVCAVVMVRMFKSPPISMDEYKENLEFWKTQEDE